VPGESSPLSPLITDSRNASGLSIVPPAVRRATDHNPFQTNSGISGLFTPAQRSEGGTPVQLEDEAVDGLISPQNGADKDEAAPDISSMERSITHSEYGKDAKDLNEPVKFQLLSSDEPQSRIGPVDVGADENSPTGHGSAKPIVSHSGALVPHLHPEYVIGTPIIADGDEDADGEADPDYSSSLGTKTFRPKPAHQLVGEGGEVTSTKTSNDITGIKVIATGLEISSMR
jgi:hypothetical protein